MTDDEKRIKALGAKVKLLADFKVVIDGNKYVSFDWAKESDAELRKLRRAVKELTRKLKYRDSEIQRLERTTTTAQHDRTMRQNVELHAQLKNARRDKEYDEHRYQQMRAELSECKIDLDKAELALMNSWGPGEWLSHVKERWERCYEEWVRKFPGVPVMPETERGWFIESLTSYQHANLALRVHAQQLAAEVEALKKERKPDATL